MDTTNVSSNGITLRVDVAGRGPSVLLLHGFPDSGRTWRHQVGPLVEAGYQVVVPDLRGFGDSDRPDAPERYALPELVGDVERILDSTQGVAHVVAHDAGGFLGWVVATLLPQRCLSLTTLSVCHPNVFSALPVEQLEKSWYTFLFQHRAVAEEALRRDDWALLRAFLRHHPETGRFVADLSRPGALTSALDWYRANITPARLVGLGQEPLPPCAVPALALWGDRDGYLLEDLVVRSGDHIAADWEYQVVPDAGHWPHLDRPAVVTGHLLRFLERQAVAGPPGRPPAAR